MPEGKQPREVTWEELRYQCGEVIYFFSTEGAEEVTDALTKAVEQQLEGMNMTFNNFHGLIHPNGKADGEESNEQIFAEIVKIKRMTDNEAQSHAVIFTKEKG